MYRQIVLFLAAVFAASAEASGIIAPYGPLAYPGGIHHVAPYAHHIPPATSYQSVVKGHTKIVATPYLSPYASAYGHHPYATAYSALPYVSGYSTHSVHPHPVAYSSYPYGSGYGKYGGYSSYPYGSGYGKYGGYSSYPYASAYGNYAAYPYGASPYYG